MPTVLAYHDVTDVDHWLGGSKEKEGDVFSQLRAGRMLEDMERRLIERTLKQYGGHRVKSAKALGMGVRTLGLKLKQWREQDTADKARGGQLQSV